MYEFFTLLGGFYTDICSLFQSVVFTENGFKFNLFDLLLACIVIGFVGNLFWKGARA